MAWEGYCHGKWHIIIENASETSGNNKDYEANTSYANDYPNGDTNNANTKPFKQHGIPQLFCCGAYRGKDSKLPCAFVQGDSEARYRSKRSSLS